MKVYQAVYREGETEGVYALSVVEDPAMQDMWIAFSEHPKTIELAQVDEDKRLLLGAALIPNKKIYRNIDGHEFYITFNEETIEQLAHNFISKGNQNNSSLEHEVQLQGMSVVENWIVEDPLKDKSANFGKEYPKGTWVAMMKVEDDQVWNKVKNGEIKGFSIDALLSLEEIKLKNDYMTKTDFLDAIKAAFTDNKVEEEQVAQEEVKAEEVETAEEVVEETPQFDAEAFKQEMRDVVNEALTQFKADFEVKLSEISKEKEEVEAKVEELEVELSKEPEAEPIKAKPEVKKEVVVAKAQSIKGRVAENLANFWE